MDPDRRPILGEDPLRLAALCGLIGPPLGLGLVLAAVARSPWFSWRTNALSDRGWRAGTALNTNEEL